MPPSLSDEEQQDDIESPKTRGGGRRREWEGEGGSLQEPAAWRRFQMKNVFSLKSPEKVNQGRLSGSVVRQLVNLKNEQVLLLIFLLITLTSSVKIPKQD